MSNGSAKYQCLWPAQTALRFAGILPSNLPLLTQMTINVHLKNNRL